MNTQIAKILREFAVLLEIKRERHKARAYDRAALSLESLPESLTYIYKRGGRKELYKIPAIGLGIAYRIEEYIKTGKIQDFEKLRQIVPEKDFIKKNKKRIQKRKDFVEKYASRLPLYKTLPYARKILADFQSGQRAELVGSLRRMDETIDTIDILVSSKLPEKIVEKIKTSVKLSLGLDLNVYVMPEESFGSGLLYYTGNKEHLEALNKVAIKKGYKDLKLIKAKTEQEIYEKLGLEYIAPELRNNTGEIETAKKYTLPALISKTDIKGDLHVHTNWTDGNFSIKQMALAAKKLGYQYICISDHTKSLAMVGGLTEEELLEQMEEIDKVQGQMTDFKILKGAEVNILKDGTLDIADEILAKLDVCGAAVHSQFRMEEKEMTLRIIKAMENPHVDIIFHPTGRIINYRDPYKVNIDALIKTAKRTGTLLELDGYPSRLDLKDVNIRKCVQAGVKFSIDTDAHTFDHYKFMEYGISQARRGWATANDVINSRNWRDLLKLMK